MTDTSRQAFEAFMRERHPALKLGRWDDDSYRSAVAHDCWDAWQASGAAQSTVKQSFAAVGDRGEIIKALLECLSGPAALTTREAAAIKDAADMLEADGALTSEGTKAQQVAVPQAMDDLAGVSVCCGDFARCHRPCTPRGQWIATKAYQVTIPPGYVLVPIEPTEEMIAAGRASPCTTDEEDMDEDYRAVYKAMLAAAQGEKP